MNARHTLLLALLSLACSGGRPERKPKNELTIEVFEATPAMVEPGQTTTLRYRVSGASSVRIEVMGGAVVLNPSTDVDGEIATPPLEASTTFVLSANGFLRGTEVMGTLEVLVGKEGAPAIRAFRAMPEAIEPGASSELSWEVLNTSTVAISGELSGVVYRGSETSGTVTVSPAASERFTLVAGEGSGAAEESVMISVTATPTSGPMITELTASPNPIAVGSAATISWTTLASTRVRLLEGPVELLNTTTEVAQGSLQVSPRADTSYLLIATDDAQTTSRSITVYAHAEPVIISFGASPAQITGPTNVTISWEVSNVAQLTLTQDGAPVPGFMGPNSNTSAQSSSSMVTVQVSQPALFELTAVSAAGTKTARASVGTAGGTCGNGMREAGEQCDRGDMIAGDGCSATCQLEIHPNVISGTGGMVTLNLGPNDIGTVRVNVQNGQAITAIADDATGTACDTVDTWVTLRDGSFGFLGSKSDGGPAGAAGECAAIVYPGDAFAADLAAGAHYLSVYNEGNTTGSVEVQIGIGDPVCGNDLTELRTEQCDDGNLVAGDLCDANCMAETIAFVTLPSANPVTVQGALTPAGNRDLIRVDVTGDHYLLAETFAPNAGAGCATADMALGLLDARFELIGQDFSAGMGDCAAFTENMAFARVTSGTYYLVVAEEGDDATIPSHQIVVDSVPVGTSSPRLEAEPNGDQAAATPLMTNASTIQGSIQPEGDDDVYSFVVPAGQTRMVTARTYDTIGMPLVCEPSNDATDVRMFLEAAGQPALEPGSGELVYNDDVDTAGGIWCAGFGPTMVTAGSADTTFYVRVQGYDDFGLRYYLLDVSVQ